MQHRQVSFRHNALVRLLTITAALKESILRRKFFALWKSRADQKRLSRRAERRRGRLAASIKAANEKKRREEAELAEIQEAQVFRKQLQENQRRKNEEMEQKRKEKRAHFPAQQTAMKAPSTNPAQQAGQKRKMLANSASQTNIQGIAMSPMHKRSKTLGSSGNAEVLRVSNSLPARSPRASLTGSTNLRRSISQKSLRQSLTLQRLDQTQTDYFRLKAHGVDPDTPLIPETAAQVVARKQREENYRQSIDDRVMRRPSSTLNRSTSRSSTPSSSAQSARALPPPVSVLASTSAPQSAPVASTVVSSVDEDPFLRQLREAREALSTDESWFKTHTSELETEMGQQELRRSLGSQSNTSQDNPSTLSANGFARSISGYEYVPPELKPGQTLSRTEERIRRTGARGLASKPIGGTPKPIAMSRKSAQQLHSAETAVQGRKRSIDHIDHIDGDTVALGHYQQQSVGQFAEHTTSKKARPNGVTMKALEALQRSSPLNPFDAGSPDDELDDEDEGTEEYDDDVEQDEVLQARDGSAVAYNDDNEADTEASGEYADEFEQAVYQEDEEEEDIHYPDLRAYDYGEEEEVEVDEDGIPLPPRGKSAATSTPDTGTGAGSTVDAAIELSD